MPTKTWPVALLALLSLPSLVQANLSQAERLPGEYFLSGTNNDGSSYTGTLSIQQTGHSYFLEWTIAEQTYLGIALLQGNHLTTVIGENASCTVTAFQRDTSGRLDGLWVSAGNAATGAEVAFVEGDAGSSPSGRYFIRGLNTDGSSYEGVLQVRPQGELLSFDWDVVTTYRGIGIQRDSQITVVATDDPEAECTVGMYEIVSDGSLLGFWGMANARQLVLDGTEVAKPRERVGTVGGAFTVSYERTANDEFRQVGELLGHSKVLESRARTFSESLVLPNDVPVVVTECGVEDAYYDPNNQRIVMCYEILQRFAAQANATEQSEWDLTDFVAGNGSAVLLHEIGHALVHVLDLPITGREEDAVDDLATTTLLGLGGESTLAAYAAARSWQLMAYYAQGLPQPMWGEHSLPEQRMYRIWCLIYGSDPETHGGLLEQGFLPPERAERCPWEYTRISSSWARLLAPHRRSSQ